MPRSAPRLPAEKVTSYELEIDSWKLGVVTLLLENRTPEGAVVEADNLIQVQDGVWAPKWGSAFYTLPAPANIDGAEEVVNPDGSTEIIEVAGGQIYRSKNGGVKIGVTLSGSVLTPGYDCFFKQIHGFLYITNGHDPLVRYDSSAKTAVAYTPLGVPAAPTAVKTGLTGATVQAFYVIVAANLVGTTIGSPEIAVAVGKIRDEWAGGAESNTTDFITLTIPRLAGADRYNIFYSDQSGYELYLDSIADPGTDITANPNVTYVDNGITAVNDFVELPNDDTTSGPLFTQMELSGNRIWSTGDPYNPWRVYWAGVGQYSGAFSSYYGGGYIDLELGGRERPTVVKHYRDGKGTALATVLTSDPEGNGSTWQISLDTVTVGSTSFIVPTATKIVGSIGCSSPRGAASAGDDILFGNQKGAFSLGSEPSLLNVLSTAEVSANIRTSWRALTGKGMNKHANYTFDAKVFWAVPDGDVVNTQIWIRDLEKENWQIGWTGVGVQSFFEYVDSNGATHLLGVPVNGNQLIEFSPSIRGDLGQPYSTRLKTGSVPVDAKDHNVFAQLEWVYLELGNPLGTVTMDVYGYDYKKGYTYLTTITIQGGSSSNEDWGYPWSTAYWSEIDTAPTITTLSTVRKAKRLNKLVNSLQFIITTSNLSDYFNLLNVGASGFIVDVDPPPSWKAGNAIVSVNRTIQDFITDETGDPITDETGDPLLP